MFTEILKMASDYGWVAIVAFGVIFLFYKLLVQFIGDKFKNVNVLAHSKNNNQSELQFHPFFNNAEYRIQVEIPSLDLMPTKPTKQQMFRDLILIETKIIYDVCTSLTKIDMDSWSEDQWISEISKSVNQIVLTVFKKSREEGIPELAIMKYNKWHSSSYEMLYDYINVLGNSPVYQNNLARTNTFFLIMNLLLITTIADAERSLKELNGEIAGKMYKNMIIEN